MGAVGPQPDALAGHPPRYRLDRRHHFPFPARHHAADLDSQDSAGHVARREFGCDRLAARIKDLRNDGHTIHTKTIKVFNRDGQPCRVAEYWLVRSDAAQGGASV